MKNNILLLSFLIVACFMNCDGRGRIYKTNANIFTENNQLDTFSEKIKFVPEAKVEIVTDTILNNGFQIKIVYNSIENSSVLKTENNSTSTIHYKDFEAKLHVLKNGSTINQSLINKKKFNAFENASFWESAIMQYVWIDYEASTAYKLFFNTSFNIPNTEIYKDFVLMVDASGTIQIKENNRSANII